MNPRPADYESAALPLCYISRSVPQADRFACGQKTSGRRPPLERFVIIYYLAAIVNSFSRFFRRSLQQHVLFISRPPLHYIVQQRVQNASDPLWCDAECGDVTPVYRKHPKGKAFLVGQHVIEDGSIRAQIAEQQPGTPLPLCGEQFFQLDSAAGKAAVCVQEMYVLQPCGDRT